MKEFLGALGQADTNCASRITRRQRLFTYRYRGRAHASSNIEAQRRQAEMEKDGGNISFGRAQHNVDGNIRTTPRGSSTLLRAQL